MPSIYYKMTALEAKVYRQFEINGSTGMNPSWAFKRCAEKEVYQEPQDRLDDSLVNLMWAATSKYERAFKSLKKAGILACVKRGPKPCYAVTV